MLEWAIERFAPRLSISTAFQTDGAGAARTWPTRSIRDPHLQRRHGPAARRDVRADRADARALPRACSSTCSRPRGATVNAWSAKHGPNLFYRSVESRLLCCQVRKVLPLPTASRRARRVDHRPPPRPVGDAQRHPQGRDRPRPRCDRQAQPARRMDRGGGAGTTCASTSCPTTTSTTRATRRSAARPARARRRPGEDLRAGRWWWETGAPKECGIHCAIETGGLEHELHAILGEDADD